MLLANISAAQHIAVHLPEQALLRRHDNPIDRRLVSGYPSAFKRRLTLLCRTHSWLVLSASVIRWTPLLQVL